MTDPTEVICLALGLAVGIFAGYRLRRIIEDTKENS